MPKKPQKRINTKALETALYNDMVSAIEGVFKKYGISFMTEFLSELLPIPEDLDITIDPRKRVRGRK